LQQAARFRAVGTFPRDISCCGLLRKYLVVVERRPYGSQMEVTDMFIPDHSFEWARKLGWWKPGDGPGDLDAQDPEHLCSEWRTEGILSRRCWRPANDGHTWHNAGTGVTWQPWERP
jgi:hypothetical protein